jgi:opacity protein-like surface antigen
MTVGGGGEYAFGRNWSAKVKYLYVDLGEFNTQFPNSAPGFTDAITVVGSENPIHLIRDRRRIRT